MKKTIGGIETYRVESLFSPKYISIFFIYHFI